MALLAQVRAAIVTKANTDIAALRRASGGRPRRALGGLPQVFVHLPTFSMESRPGGATERYTLVYPGDLSIATPAGEQRADTKAEDLLYGLIVSWRSGIQLGLGSSGVQTSWLSNATPSYDESDLLDGYDLSWTVEVLETLNPTRTV